MGKKKRKTNKVNISLYIVLILVVCFSSFKVINFSFKKLMSNVYEISEIKSNIDNVKVGDTIKYEANGYSDWQVLYIDKENNTLDIVSKTNPETVLIDDVNTALNVLQEVANKYLDGNYAISARSVNQNDLNNFNYDSNFWVANVGNSNLLYTEGYVNTTNIDTNVRVVPWVTYRVNDTSSLNVGDEYSILINGINDWIITSIESNQISMVPKNPKRLSKLNVKCETMQSIVDNYINEFRVEGVISVRNLNNSDLSTLQSISHFNSSPANLYYYTGNPYYSNSGWYTFYNERVNYDYYKYNIISYYNYNNTFGTSEYYCYQYKYTLGFRPVVTIKYSDDLVESKNLDTDIKVGDNVKYSANEYNNWKVLSINYDTKTVDIVSGGIVKNLTLKGLEDYNNFETIIQNEVDVYKTENDVISARLLNINDLESLKNIKDKTVAKYFLNNKHEYHSKNRSYYNSVTNYYTTQVNEAVAIASYDKGTESIIKNWAVLNSDMDNADGYYLSSFAVGPHSYTAGIRPVITIKIENLQKEDKNNVTDSNTEKNIINEQKELNKETLKPLSDKSFSELIEETKEETGTVDTVKKKEIIIEEYKTKETYTKYKKYKSKVKGSLVNIIILNILVILILLILSKNKKRKKSK